MNKFAYVIEFRKNRHKWFFSDLVSSRDNISSIIWTPRLKSAQLFLSEEIVEEFKSSYISPRKVSILRLPLIVMPQLDLDLSG